MDVALSKLSSNGLEENDGWSGGCMHGPLG